MDLLAVSQLCGEVQRARGRGDVDVLRVPAGGRDRVTDAAAVGQLVQAGLRHRTLDVDDETASGRDRH